MLTRPYFHDEKAAYEHLQAVLWPNGNVCPHCGSMAKPRAIEGARSRPGKEGKPGKIRGGLKSCVDCRKQFTVTVGTSFERVHIPLNKLLQAIYLMCASRKGVGAYQLHQTLEITYKTVRALAHRIERSNVQKPIKRMKIWEMSQRQKFIKCAYELEADMNEEAFDSALRRIAKAKTAKLKRKARPRKESSQRGTRSIG